VSVSTSSRERGRRRSPAPGGRDRRPGARARARVGVVGLFGGLLLLAGCGERSDAGGPAGGGADVSASGAPGAAVSTDAVTGEVDSASASAAAPVEVHDSLEAPEPGTAPQTLSVEDRLDLLIAVELGTRQRLDSLAGAIEALRDGAPSSASSTGAGTSSSATGQASDVLDEAGSRVRNFGVALALALAVIVLFNFLIRGVTWILDQLSERSAKRRLFFKGLVPIVRILLWLFAGYLIVRGIFRVDAQGVVAGAAAIGVAVGFAAQDLLKNLFGGIILVFDQPFQVGDKIRVGETYGEVTSIGLRSTRIVTPDDNLVSVPNAQVVDQQVANANAGELNCQVVIDLYLPRNVDEREAKRIAFEAAVGSRYVYLNKPITVLIRDELAHIVLTRVRVKAYVLDPRHEFLFESDVTERAREGFREAGLIGSDPYGLGAWMGLAPGAGEVAPSWTGAGSGETHRGE